MRTSLQTLSFIVLSSVVVNHAEAGLIYGNNIDLGVIKQFNPTTSVGSTSSLSNAQAISGLAADDANQRLYVSFGPGGTSTSQVNNVFTYDYNGNLLTSVRTANSSNNGLGWNGLTYGNGTLYGVRSNGTTGIAGIYSIAPTTGVNSLFATLAIPSSSGQVFYNFTDIEYDAANSRFIGIATNVLGPGGTSAGLYSIVAGASPTILATVSLLAGVPSGGPLTSGGNPVTPSGIALNAQTVYLTWDSVGTVARYSLSDNAYLSNLTGPTQASNGASGDAAWSNSFVGIIPEPTMLGLIPTAAVFLTRRGRRRTSITG